MADKSRLLLFDAAFRILEPELKAIDQAPKTLEAFVDRLISPTSAGSKKSTGMSMEHAERYVSCAEFANTLGVCKKSIENWARHGLIPRIMAGRKVRIPLGAALAALEDKSNQGGQQ